MRFVEPSLLASNAIGRTPRSNVIVQTGSSVFWSITVAVLPTTEPATT